VVGTGWWWEGGGGGNWRGGRVGRLVSYSYLSFILCYIVYLGNCVLTNIYNDKTSNHKTL
jgi:hypothetical protein